MAGHGPYVVGLPRECTIVFVSEPAQGKSPSSLGRTPHPGLAKLVHQMSFYGRASALGDVNVNEYGRQHWIPPGCIWRGQVGHLAYAVCYSGGHHAINQRTPLLCELRPLEHAAP